MEKPIHQKATRTFNSVGKFLLLNLVIALVITFSFCPSCFLSLEGLIAMFDNFLFAFLMSSLLSFGGTTVENFYNKRISWIDYPVKRLVLTAGTYLVYTFVVSFVMISLLLLTTVDGVTLDTISWSRIVSYTGFPVGLAFIIITIFIARAWLMEWRKATIEAEQLKTEKMASKYQSLKDQLNPHFLFNSLNALSNLVHEDADQSVHFIQQLSRIYRYVLDVQQEELVNLDKELEFAKNYLSLQKLRFDNSLQYEIIIKSTQGFYLPPLSLQLLLENCIKHNIASNAHPLVIQIEQKNEELWVSNKLQPKLDQLEGSTGVGLKNIQNRYEVLSNKQISVSTDEQLFTVKLPLLKLSQ